MQDERQIKNHLALALHRPYRSNMDPPYKTPRRHLGGFCTAGPERGEEKGDDEGTPVSAYTAHVACRLFLWSDAM